MSERILYLDLVGGAAGDMLLGALLDLGAPIESVRDVIQRMGLENVELKVDTVHPAGLRAVQVDVMVGGILADSETPEGAPSTVHADGAHGHHHHPHGGHHRPWTAIRDLLAELDIDPKARALAQEAFRRLADAEAKAHGVPLEEVVFHEVGADDALVDIVGSAVAFVELKVDRVVASPFPMGRGIGKGSHGPFPVPAPATLEILKGAPLAATPLESETVTPTGAALVQTLADSYGPLPDMRSLLAVGVGAGHKRWPDRPNVLRGLLGEVGTGLPDAESDVVELQCNIDDMNPEHLTVAMQAALQAGAVDVWAQPATFKKGRVGLVLSALAPRELEPAVSSALLVHTPSLGIRMHEVLRRKLRRELQVIETPYGRIRIKVSERPGGAPFVKPEHDDVAQAAERSKVSLRDVERAVFRALDAQS